MLNVTLRLVPGSNTSVSKAPLAAVALCGFSPMFTQVTVSPTFTVIDAGWNPHACGLSRLSTMSARVPVTCGGVAAAGEPGAPATLAIIHTPALPGLMPNAVLDSTPRSPTYSFDPSGEKAMLSGRWMAVPLSPQLLLT